MRIRDLDAPRVLKVGAPDVFCVDIHPALSLWLRSCESWEAQGVEVRDREDAVQSGPAMPPPVACTACKLHRQLMGSAQRQASGWHPSLSRFCSHATLLRNPANCVQVDEAGGDTSAGEVDARPRNVAFCDT